MNIHSNLLDTLIAFVVVILLLSLIVQSVQGVLKKLFKIKSRQIEDSLLDLFQNALGQPPALSNGELPKLEASPFLRIFAPRRFTNPAPTAPAGQADPVLLQKQVMDVFAQLGRVAQSGKPMLDSLAKGDLLQAMQRVEPKHLLGDSAAGELLKRLQTAVEAVSTLAGEFEALSGNAALRGEASAKFNAFKAAVTPLFDDCINLTAALPPAGSVLIHDLLSIRQVQMKDAMKLLADVQQQVQKDEAAAADDTAKKTLHDLDGTLSKIADGFGTLQGVCASVTAALQDRIDAVGRWFDTVMQSFEERYTRGMKTWGLVIAFAVVVVLNANFFHIYRAISGSETVRQRILAQAGQVQHLDKLARQAESANASSRPDQASAALAEMKQTLQTANNEVTQEQSLYTDLGFSPLGRAQIAGWWAQEGKDKGEWFIHTISILGGWILMTLLLSVGAPFWEDALESLFGLKNIIRQDSSTKNVEQNKGAGQPKS